MYDEFERAVNGGGRQGMPFLGKAILIFGALVAVGGIGASFVVHKVRREVHRVIREGPMNNVMEASQVARLLAGGEFQHKLLAATPDEGLQLLRDLRSGDPAGSLVQELIQGSRKLGLRERTPEAEAAAENGMTVEAIPGVEALPAEDAGSLTIGSDDGEVRFDLVRDDQGGSLVINSDDGEVRFNLSRTERGGFLTIDSDEGQVRFDLVRAADGGSLSINSEDGQVRFDLHRSGDGSELVVRTEEGMLRLGSGAESEPVPAWVPMVDGAPATPEHIFSATSHDGFLGAVAWQTDQTSEDILQYYRDTLREAGYDIRSEQVARSRERRSASLWAKDEASGRLVFLVAEGNGGMTKVVLGYGAETD